MLGHTEPIICQHIAQEREAVDSAREECPRHRCSVSEVSYYGKSFCAVLRAALKAFKANAIEEDLRRERTFTAKVPFCDSAILWWRDLLLLCCKESFCASCDCGIVRFETCAGN